MRKLDIGVYSKTKKKIRNKKLDRKKLKSEKQLLKEKVSLDSFKEKIKANRIVRKQKKKFNFKKILIIFIPLIFFGLIGLGYWRLVQVNSRVDNYDEFGKELICTNILNPKCWTDAFKPQLKQTDGYTNALLLGTDTRAGTSSLLNTDTIMIASFNHNTQKVMLISIPRDLYVKEYSTRINAVYAYTYKKDPADPYKYIKEQIGKMIGKPIHYVAMIRLEGVIQGIDEIGGVEVCPKDSFTAKYPDDYHTTSSGWLYYDFSAGCQTVDGERALVYARFRHITKGPGYLASDYSRADRQQEIVEAAKNKLLSEDLSISERAEKYWSLLGTYKENVHVEIGFEDILAGLAFIDSADRDPANVVLDPYFGGLNKYIKSQSIGGASTIVVIDTTYKSIQKELARIEKNIDFYRETPKISVINASGINFTDTHAVKLLEKETEFDSGFYITNEAKTEKFYGIKVFDFTVGTKPNSLKLILTYLGIEKAEEGLPDQYGFSKTSKDEDFLIIVGPDLPADTPITTP